MKTPGVSKVWDLHVKIWTLRSGSQGLGSKSLVALLQGLGIGHLRADKLLAPVHVSVRLQDLGCRYRIWCQGFRLKIFKIWV